MRVWVLLLWRVRVSRIQFEDNVAEKNSSLEVEYQTAFPTRLLSFLSRASVISIMSFKQPLLKHEVTREGKGSVDTAAWGDFMSLHRNRIWRNVVVASFAYLSLILIRTVHLPSTKTTLKVPLDCFPSQRICDRITSTFSLKCLLLKFPEFLITAPRNNFTYVRSLSPLSWILTFLLLSSKEFWNCLSRCDVSQSFSVTMETYIIYKDKLWTLSFGK